MSKDLIPQPKKGGILKAAIRALFPNATWDAIKNARDVYLAIVGGGAVIGTAATSLIQRLQGVPQDLLGILLIAVLWLLVLTVAYSVSWRRRKRTQSTNEISGSESAGVKFINDGAGKVDNSPETINATLNAKFESEKAAIQSKHESELKTLRDTVESLQSKREDYAEEIEGRKRAFTGLQRKYDTLLEQNKGLHAELAKLTWLYNLAAKQAEDISRYVVVEQIRFCYHDFTAPIPYLIFGVDIHNKSVFDITIENAMEGHIGLAGEPLRGDKELWHNPKISPSGKESLTLRQRLKSEEVELVTKCENNELGAFYYFDKLIIKVAARTQFPEFESSSLELPLHIGSKDSPLSNEIASLKAQLEEERAKREKPDITGKINGVYCETWGNAKLGDDGRVWFDHHFAVNTFVTNRGAKTTIERFKLVLKAGGHSYEGVREKATRDLKDGEINWRKWGEDQLGDLEKSNDEPLEYSRNGWLWFVVFRVGNVENKAEMELELYAVDKDGISYKLDTSPQPQWQRNPFKYKEMVAAQRARMKEHF